MKIALLTHFVPRVYTANWSLRRYISEHMQLDKSMLTPPCFPTLCRQEKRQKVVWGYIFCVPFLRFHSVSLSTLQKRPTGQRTHTNTHFTWLPFYQRITLWCYTLAGCSIYKLIFLSIEEKRSTLVDYGQGRLRSLPHWSREKEKRDVLSV